MKTKISFTTVLLTINIFLLTSFSIAQWELQYPVPTDVDLEDICFVDDNNGWAVGELGAIIHTSDGGITWSYQNSNTTLRLRSIMFTDSQTGWIVGGDVSPEEYIILHTFNGGDDWIIEDSNTTTCLTSVFFVDADNGWAVGNHNYIFHTNNGGNNWILQQSGTGYPNLFEVFFTDLLHGWSTSSSGLIKTTDGGQNWSLHVDGNFESVFFLDQNEGWASMSVVSGLSSTSGILIHTTDAFTTFDTIYQCYSSGEFTSCDFHSIHFKDPLNGWMLFDQCMNTGWGGYLFSFSLLKSTDGGNSWDDVELNNGSSFIGLNALSFTSEGKGSIVANHGIIYETSNWKDDWACLSDGNSITFHSIDFVNSLNGWAVGGSNIYPNWNNQKSYILHTSNGGAIWENQNSPILGSLNSVNFCNSYTGYAVGNSNDTAFIIKTLNSGEDWFVQKWDTGYSLNSIQFVNESQGWAVGDAGIILMSTNGGVDWGQQNVDSNQFFNSVHFVDNMCGWAVGSSVYHTIDGGQNWIEQPYDTSGFWLTSVHFTDVENGWIVGHKGTFYGIILHTVDGGSLWTSEIITDRLSSVNFKDIENGLISCLNGKILRTNDGGETWLEENSGTNNSLNTVCFTDEGHGYAAGEWGTIVHSESLITSLNNPSNNYNLVNELYCSPNPFNDNINLSYTLHEKTWVSIEIYNSNGQLIINHKETFREKGQHKLTLDVDFLRAGIYFCVLLTKQGYQTQKIIKR